MQSPIGHDMAFLVFDGAVTALGLKHQVFRSENTDIDRQQRKEGAMVAAPSKSKYYVHTHTDVSRDLRQERRQGHSS
jgi:hypothetical protein